MRMVPSRAREPIWPCSQATLSMSATDLGRGLKNCSIGRRPRLWSPPLSPGPASMWAPAFPLARPSPPRHEVFKILVADGSLGVRDDAVGLLQQPDAQDGASRHDVGLFAGVRVGPGRPKRAARSRLVEAKRHDVSPRARRPG